MPTIPRQTVAPDWFRFLEYQASAALHRGVRPMCGMRHPGLQSYAFSPYTTLCPSGSFPCSFRVNDVNFCWEIPVDQPNLTAGWTFLERCLTLLATQLTLHGF